jgi:dimethylaniline monooxygenase (N-oxide forming)
MLQLNQIHAYTDSHLSLSMLGTQQPEYAKSATAAHAGAKDLHELISQAPKTGKRVAVIGIAISGIQAMKACLAEGLEPVGIEADSDVGGFWRFKENAEHPSVYRSTHIDTDRDMNSFGDFPWSPDKPLLIHNEELTRYLRKNIEEFSLTERIRLRTKVEWVTPIGEPGPDNKWEVTMSTTHENGEVRTTVEEFDGVMVCTGRHGGGGFIPRIEGLDKFAEKHFVCHSSMYKFPQKHSLVGKRVVVVGVGNSGIDIVTELGPVAKECYLVGRSGGWVMESKHMEVAQGEVFVDRLMLDGISRLPWWRG